LWPKLITSPQEYTEMGRDAIVLTEAEAVGMTLQPAALIVDDGHGRTT
jgi:hypothetical protein